MKFIKPLIVIMSFILATPLFSQTLSEKLTDRRNKSTAKKAALGKVKKKAPKANQELAKQAKKALGIGKELPPIDLINNSNKKVSLNSIIAGETAVITFYRGAWCPYCMMELDHYESMLSDFEKAGIKIVAISPDTVTESKKMKKKRNLSFPVLSDPNNTAAKQLGLAFKVDKETLKRYLKHGINLKKSQDNDNGELPMPGTYVIDKKGVIRFSFVDPDYTKRAEPSMVLDIARKISGVK